MTKTPHEDASEARARARPEDFGVRLLFDTMNDGVVLADDRGRIVLWSPSAVRLLGYDADEAYALTIEALVPPELKARHRAGLAHFIRTGHGRLIDSGRPYEVPALRKDGTRVFVDITLTPLQHHGRTYVLAVLRDVHERVMEREREERHRKQLQDAIDSLEAFSHVIAHDLKEPVRGMTAFLDELEESPDAPDRVEKLRRAAEANRNLRRLLDGLLEWSRTTMTPLEPRELDLAVVLRDTGCSAQWQTLQGERSATVEISPHLPTIMGTEALVCRVFGNLITNGIRHNPDARPRVIVRPGEPQPPGRVEVVIEDNGPGFPERLIQRVQAMPNKPSTIKGGFGLAITRRAIDRLDGKMALENKADGGGLVRLQLPAPQAPPSLEERVRELI